MPPAAPFMEEWQEYTMNDRCSSPLRLCPVPVGKEGLPGAGRGCRHRKLWKLIFDVCRVTGGDPVNEWQAISSGSALCGIK